MFKVCKRNNFLTITSNDKYAFFLHVEYFGKNILVGDFKEIFDFITSPNVDDGNYESKLDEILSRSRKWENLDVLTEVFRQSFIPRKMEEV